MNSDSNSIFIFKTTMVSQFLDTLSIGTWTMIALNVYFLFTIYILFFLPAQSAHQRFEDTKKLRQVELNIKSSPPLTLKQAEEERRKDADYIQAAIIVLMSFFGIAALDVLVLFYFLYETLCC